MDGTYYIIQFLTGGEDRAFASCCGGCLWTMSIANGHHHKQLAESGKRQTHPKLYFVNKSWSKFTFFKIEI